MHLTVLPSAEAVALAAASIVAAEARTGVRDRGRFVLAVSGGRTPGQMFDALTREDLPWHGVHIVQVDERIAPAGHADRNLTGLRESLLEHVPLRSDQIHAMPVEAVDLDAAPASYGQNLSEIAGSPPVLDLIHLGLGSDGHTASLIPGDRVLDVMDRDVALTDEYQGRRRMTLTYRALNRSRQILWVVSGRDKAAMLARLMAGDRSIPAGRVDQTHARVLADSAAAARLRP